MKKKYKILLIIFGIEYLFVSILNKSNIKIDSVIGTILGLVLFFAPIVVLLYLLGKDMEISPKYRILSKILNVFILVSFIAGFIVKLLGLED